jgi:hypothetical protein
MWCLLDYNLQEPSFSIVEVGGKFAWDQVAEERNQIVLNTPQTALYQGEVYMDVPTYSHSLASKAASLSCWCKPGVASQQSSPLMRSWFPLHTCSSDKYT